jgi:hypothetical protein
VARTADDRRGEIEDAVITAGWTTDEHVDQHLLGDGEGSGEADE